MVRREAGGKRKELGNPEQEARDPILAILESIQDEV